MERTSPRLAVVTGFSSGIGFEVARGLAEEGWRIVGVARDPIRARRAVEILRAQTGNPGLHFHTADLSLVTEAHTVAQRIRQQSPRIDLLVNNAGAMFRCREETVEGIERTVALNHLGMFTITQSLLPALNGRIVNVASAAHIGATLDLADLGLNDNYHGWTQYRRSKLMNILFTRELARRLPENVTATCVHPGFVATRFGSGNGWIWKIVIKLLMLSAISPRESAKGVLRVALDPALASANGQYFDRGHPARPTPEAEDDVVAGKLWAESESIVTAILADAAGRAA